MNLSDKDKNEKKPTINLKYKDSFFTKLYSQADAICDLYNKELHQGENIKEQDVEIITLDNILMNSYYNDLGFIVKDKLIILVEHQSTVNGNMPLRMLIYLVEEYKKYIRQHDLNLHRSKPVKLPKPELYLIYTGDKEFSGDKLTFGEDGDSLFVSLKYSLIREPKVNNSTLEGYLTIVKVTENFEQEDKLDAIKDVIQAYLKRKDRNPILAKFLISHETEVIEMLKERLEVEKIIEAKYEDGYEEGIEEGIEKGIEKGIERGRIKAILSLYLNGTIDEYISSKQLGISVEQFMELVHHNK